MKATTVIAATIPNQRRSSALSQSSLLAVQRTVKNVKGRSSSSKNISRSLSEMQSRNFVATGWEVFVYSRQYNASSLTVWMIWAPMLQPTSVSTMKSIESSQVRNHCGKNAVMYHYSASNHQWPRKISSRRSTRRSSWTRTKNSEKIYERECK